MIYDFSSDQNGLQARMSKGSQAELPKRSPPRMPPSSPAKVPKSAQTRVPQRAPSKVPKCASPRVPQCAQTRMQQGAQTRVHFFLHLRSLRTASILRTPIIPYCLSFFSLLSRLNFGTKIAIVFTASTENTPISRNKQNESTIIVVFLIHFFLGLFLKVLCPTSQALKYWQ